MRQYSAAGLAAARGNAAKARKVKQQRDAQHVEYVKSLAHRGAVARVEEIQSELRQIEAIIGPLVNTENIR